MKLLFKDSGLDRLKASVQFCAECQKPQVHYVAAGGWPICHACGYNPDLMLLGEQELPAPSLTLLSRPAPARPFEAGFSLAEAQRARRAM